MRDFERRVTVCLGIDVPATAGGLMVILSTVTTNSVALSVHVHRISSDVRCRYGALEWSFRPLGSTMSPELEQVLYDRYPRIFACCHAPPDESSMGWGCMVGDGWHALLDELCGKL